MNKGKSENPTEYSTFLNTKKKTLNTQSVCKWKPNIHYQHLNHFFALSICVTVICEMIGKVSFDREQYQPIVM